MSASSAAMRHPAVIPSDVSARQSWSGYAYVTVVVCTFAAVLSGALTFGYIEGDDAASIAYHLLGRNSAVQLPYSPWQGMMDRWLELLPAREPVLRVAAEASTSAAACVSVVLMLMLALAWTRITKPREQACAAVAVLLAVPELFYLALVYEPSMMALMLVLVAHLMARVALTKNGVGKWFALAIAAAIFGAGAACRWDIAAYGIVIVADLALADDLRRLSIPRQRLLAAIIWVGAAVLSACAAIAASGYGLAAVRETLRVAMTEVTPRRASALHIAEVIGSQQTLFTPLLLSLLIAGIAIAMRKQRRLLLLMLLPIFPVTPYLYSREPKMLLPLFPPLLAVALLGFQRLWLSGSWRSRAAVAVLAAVPWLVGLQIEGSGTSYGPGFQRSMELPRSSTPHLQLRFNGGFAVPTPEGPRPLGGHGWVLFGGEWRAYVRNMQSEQKEAIEIAVQGGTPLLQLDRDSFLLARLLQMGWMTLDPEQRLKDAGVVAPSAVTARVFTNGERILRSIVVHPPDAIWQPGVIAELSTVAPEKRAVLYFGNYASSLRQLERTAPQATTRIGPYMAVGDLGAIEVALARESARNGELH
jgi:hypothetical protein